MKTKAIIVGVIFSCAAQGAMLDLQQQIDAAAQVPEKDGRNPEAFMFNRMPLPAYGFCVRHADNVVFDNVEVKIATPDARPRFVVEDGTFVQK
jgi:hypothetical protein